MDSTNRYILDQARLGAKEGLVVIADEQVKGRGRMQRSWSSPKGKSFSASVLFDSERTLFDAQILVKVVSLAMCWTLDKLYSLDAGIKWPNDLEVRGKKIAGVLAEVAGRNDKTQVVVGIGVNLGQNEEELSVLGRPATSVFLERPDLESVPALALLDDFLARISSLLETARSAGGTVMILSHYRDRCTTLGQSVVARLPSGETVEGMAIDLGNDGELIISAGHERHIVNAGDVENLNVWP